LTAVGLLAGQAFELLLLPALLLLTAAGVTKKKAEPAMRAVASDDARVAGPASGSAETLGSRAASVPAVPSAAVDGIRAPTQQRRVLVCLGRACRERGSVEVWRQARIAERFGLIPHGQATDLTRTSCLGRCEDGPVVQVVADGQYRLRVDGAAFTALVVDELVRQQFGEQRRGDPGPVDEART
jgi:(2Fe-2S) ferredoxin